MFKSKPYYIKVYGDYALFSTPTSKGSGERSSYSVPTREALKGIIEAIYFKPTLIIKINEVKVIKQIKTESLGIRAFFTNGESDLNNSTYLTDVEYLVKFHFERNTNREDLSSDRNEMKHQEIMERSIKKGGRRDIFLGTRECVGYIEGVTEEEYISKESYYKEQNLSFGIMFHSFIYPKVSGEMLISCFDDINMNNGVIKFKDSKDTLIQNEISNYDFKYPDQIKPVDEEHEEYKMMEEYHE